jgi:predicted signal transduction protein with EAL and GGDEF domain
MKETLREVDTLARLGGDEFVAVLLRHRIAGQRADVESGCSRPRPSRSWSMRALQVSASLGVTFYPQNDEVDADQLLRQADQAMYQAKVAGKNRYHCLRRRPGSQRARPSREPGAHPPRALTHEFVLYYQPKVNMRTGQVIGAEALIRWQHPEKGLLCRRPCFLPVIEEPLRWRSSIGEWVIARALGADGGAGALPACIFRSASISALASCSRADFPDRLAAILAAHPDVTGGRSGAGSP